MDSITAAFTNAMRNPSELFALLGIIAFVLYGLSVGRTRALISLLAMYVAYALTVLFPFQSWVMMRIPEQKQSWLGVVLFCILYVFVFTVLSSSIRRGRLTLGETMLWQIVVISIVQLGLLVSICASLIPIETSQRLLGPLFVALGGRYALWAWAAASLAILPFVRAHKRES